MKYPENYYAHIEQNTPEWLQIRCGCVTASHIKDVVLKQKNGKYYAARKEYMVDLLAETLTGRATERYVSVPMMYGIENEGLAVANYEFAKELDTEKIGYIAHPAIQRAGASPDRLVGDDGLLECKVPNTTTHLEYFEAGVPPEDYIPQMAWQLACSGRQWVDFCSYDPRLPEEFGLFIVRYHRDEELITAMEEEVLKFRAELNTMAERLLKRKGEHRASVTSLPEEENPDGPPKAVIPEWQEVPR